MDLSLYKKCPICRKNDDFTILNTNIVNDNVCCICLDEYDNNICQCKYCKNIYHVECIKQIKNNHNTIYVNIRNNLQEVPNNICYYLETCLCRVFHVIVFTLVSYLCMVAIIYSVAALHILY